MPHFKCAACSTGLYSAASPSSPFSDFCPDCGSPVEALPIRAEAITRSAGAAVSAAPIVRNSVGARIGHVIARREVVRAQVRVDAERWAGDGGT
jgi:hypothetical protein